VHDHYVHVHDSGFLLRMNRRGNPILRTWSFPPGSQASSSCERTAGALEEEQSC
jgi:hypothetical protein